jgi:hypothetical protein
MEVWPMAKKIKVETRDSIPTWKGGIMMKVSVSDVVPQNKDKEVRKKVAESNLIVYEEGELKD